MSLLGNMNKPKILTIDDEVEFVEMIKNYFSLRGYDVFTALRGVAGLKIIEKEKPDVVLIDLKMAGINGDQVLKQMQKLHPEGKAIIITAFKDEGETEKKFLDMGAFAYFEKPISSLKELEDTIKKAIDNKEENKSV